MQLYHDCRNQLQRERADGRRYGKYVVSASGPALGPRSISISHIISTNT